MSGQYCPSVCWLGGTPEHAPIWDFFTILKHSDLKLHGEPKIFEHFTKNKIFYNRRKNFQNPLLNFLVFLGFTSLRVFASKTLNEVKLRFHYSTTDFWPYFFLHLASHCSHKNGDTTFKFSPHLLTLSVSIPKNFGLIPNGIGRGPKWGPWCLCPNSPMKITLYFWFGQ